MLLLVQESYCRNLTGAIVAMISGWRRIDRFDELALQEAVATIGPISAAVFGDLKNFRVIIMFDYVILFI